MENKNIKISEPLLEDDYRAMLEILSETMFEYDLIEEELKSHSSGEILMAIFGDEVVGFVTMYAPGRAFAEYGDNFIDLKSITLPKEKIGYIKLLAVKPEFQGRGIGKKLASKAILNLKSLSSKAVVTHAWQSSPNQASQKLFESFGFKPVRVRKQPWFSYSKKVGAKKFSCLVCGNPCKCDELEMVKYL